MVIKNRCKICNKVALVDKELRIAGMTILKYSCGHSVCIADLKSSDYDTISSDGKRPYKFQLEGAKFLENCNGRGLIADQMGLGKTIQFLIFLKKHPELCPTLILCKSGLKIQWMKEIVRWCGIEFMPQIIDGSGDTVLPGLKAYIASMDILRRLERDDNNNHVLMNLGIKTVLIDEVQHIKNADSARTRQVRHLCQGMEYIVGLSGTPIKNHAGEYFPILNILQPEKFPSQRMFDWDWVDSYWDGYKMKRGGLRFPNKFKEFTKDFIIRRTREEVLPDLPQITRDFRFSDLGHEVEDAYKKTLKEFIDYHNNSFGDSGFVRESNILSYLNKMRHLTGIAKIDPCVNFVEEFILETDRKIVIFVHHKDVGVAILSKLSGLKIDGASEFGAEVLSLTADLSSEKRNGVVEKFHLPEYRILVASTLASGEGLNLQCCSDCIILERQWNPANEEQAECRFIRIGQEADKVSGTYMIAVGTIDEFFSGLVEQKRAIVSNALDGTELKWDESSLMRELGDVLAAKGGKRWNL